MNNMTVIPTCLGWSQCFCPPATPCPLGGWGAHCNTKWIYECGPTYTIDTLHWLVPVDDDVAPELGPDAAVSVGQDVAQGGPLLPCTLHIVHYITLYTVHYNLIEFNYIMRQLTTGHITIKPRTFPVTLYSNIVMHGWTWAENRRGRKIAKINLQIMFAVCRHRIDRWIDTK